MKTAWEDEKRALLSTISRHEKQTAKLLKRMKLLQKTLQEQQSVLDKYQKALVDTGYFTIMKDKTTDRKTIEKKMHEENSHIEDLETQMTESNALNSVDHSKRNASAVPTANIIAMKNTIPKKRVLDRCDHVTTSNKEKRHKALVETAPVANESTSVPVLSSCNKYQADVENKKNNVLLSDNKKSNALSYQYKEVVRSREAREALSGYDCVECRKYYNALKPLTDKNRNRQENYMNTCSRHRARFEPFQTPDDFWRLSFPDSIGD